MKDFRGSYSVLVTPFTEDGSAVDEKALRSLVEWQVEQGAPGIIMLGSTGEFLCVTDDERTCIVEATVDQIKGRIPVIMGTAAEWTEVAIRYSKEAEDLGADGLMIVPPYYCEPKDEEIFTHYRRIGEAVSIPIMLYNNPFYSNVDLRPEMVARLAEIDTIRYIKESSGDIARVQAIMRLAGENMTVFAGYHAYDAFLLGAKGWVSVSGNFMPRLSAQLFDVTVGQSDPVAGLALYDRMLPLINATDGYIARTKAALELVGMPSGRPRAPRLPATAEDVEMLRRMLVEIGLLADKAA
ncbi:MAG: dihydrodipicolinate synthase family protein [Rhodospirillales bacterium]|jgi:4-hydroxy-tetrahydrodipicolinate synthase|nr:dihydrodipicolinate synthase family protein [Rhodospirillales bacterium]MDP6883379.1 dihydrodipicolinate synthase family protein [Rhodospirillales bacterium]